MFTVIKPPNPPCAFNDTNSSTGDSRVVCMSPGAIGSALATPTDLVKVRQQAEGPNDARRHHRTLYAFLDLYRAGGFRALYVGLGPTVQRAAVLTATQARLLSNIQSLDHFVFQAYSLTERQK